MQNAIPFPKENESSSNYANRQVQTKRRIVKYAMSAVGQENVVGPEPKISVSEDGAWTLPAHGGRLHRGCNKSTGRPKKEVRQAILAEAEKSATYLMKLRDNENALPAERARAAETLLRYGLGTKDEVELIDAKRVIGEVMRSLMASGMEAGEAESAVLSAVQALGVE